MTKHLWPLLFIALLGASCGPAPVQTQTNLRIDSVWGEQLDHVALYFVRQGGAATACDSLELAGAISAKYMETCPNEDPCTVKAFTVSANPGNEGSEIYVPVGDMNLLAYGFNDMDSELGHDCVAVSVQDGKTTDIQLSL